MRRDKCPYVKKRFLCKPTSLATSVSPWRVNPDQVLTFKWLATIRGSADKTATWSTEACTYLKLHMTVCIPHKQIQLSDLVSNMMPCGTRNLEMNHTAKQPYGFKIDRSIDGRFSYTVFIVLLLSRQSRERGRQGSTDMPSSDMLRSLSRPESSYMPQLKSVVNPAKNKRLPAQI